MRRADARIFACRTAQARGLSCVHARRASGSLRNMPSPEQGASTSTASKASGHFSASLSGDSLTTAAFVDAQPLQVSGQRPGAGRTISLATRAPRPPIRAAICDAFPPGAAHRSSTTSPGCGASPSAGAWALASCM
jgi:hypothetical protein